MAPDRPEVGPSDVTGFWRDAGESAWFDKDPLFDAAFETRFLAAHERAARGEFDGWAATPDGALALLILLDQFPRNCFRGQARMFATDAKAVAIAEAAIAAGHDRAIEPDLRLFVYLPFEHAEDLALQDRCVELFRPLRADYLRFAILHRDIIARFGRFPHRNAVLKRASTAEEEAFLAEGGFAG
jgi:uncharacterized protein (DUF924 family)